MQYQLQFGPVFNEWELIRDAVIITIILAFTSIIIGFLLGVVAAQARLRGPAFLSLSIAGYVEFIRNTPFLAQLFFITFGIPQLLLLFDIQVRLSPIWLALFALSINLSGYVAEIVRAGLLSIPKEQVEAAKSLALRPYQILLRIELPPALANVYPALTSQFILHMLGTSLVSVVAVEELTSTASRIQSDTFRTFETYIVVTAIYFILALSFRLIISLIGRLSFKWRADNRGVA